MRPCPLKMTDSDEVNLDFVAWRRFDWRILNWIYSSLSPKIAAQLVGCIAFPSAWVALEKIFYDSSKAHMLQLWLQFRTLKKGSLTMMEYILKMKSITDNLAAISEPVSNQHHVMQLLGGLGPDYNSLSCFNYY